jgi:hypothetical protein
VEVAETVGVQFPSGHGQGHRTAGLALMAAVVKVAFGCQFFDLDEDVTDGNIAGQAQATQPGRVDQGAAAGDTDELAPGRGVAAPMIAFAHRTGRQYVTTQ